ncbi:MAG: dynein gamma chain protein [Coriobacteriia bacterium]|nr:dynein gamma chain protein [Coriobacteriia bacterium]
MCTNGINAVQLKGTIEQIDEAVALTRRWTHRSFHSAEDGQMPKTAAKLKSAQGLLDDVRALLEEAGDIVEREAGETDGVTVELV